jgi:pimeloyl-ACP methyl ester carboxylesterase
MANQETQMPNTHVLVGDGPHKVIALHGWFGHANGWGPFAEVLDPSRFGYAFMDARGYGGMRGRGGPYTMDQVAADAVALADHLGWKRFSLIGHSMSGVAIQLAWLAVPERVRSLVAITPVPASGAGLDEQSWGLFTAAGSDPAARRAIIDFTTGNRLSAAWLDAMVASTREHSDDAAVAGYMPSWAKASFVDRLRPLTCPLLVFAGEHDAALSEAACRATWMQHHPAAQLDVVRNAGHYPMDETPVYLATRIETFLAAAPE